MYIMGALIQSFVAGDYTKKTYLCAIKYFYQFKESGKLSWLLFIFKNYARLTSKAKEIRIVWWRLLEKVRTYYQENPDAEF